MPKNPLAAHPPWRQLVIISVALPVVVVAAVLAFAWPAARIAPRDLPVGIVGSTPASQQAVEGLGRTEPGGFELQLYADEAAARSAIHDRDIYGAFIVTAGSVTVLEASAASPMVADLLTRAGRQLADHATQAGTGNGQSTGGIAARAVDVVPISGADPHGLVFSTALLPLTICAILVAAAIALILRFRPAWRQIVALAVVSAVAGLGAYLVTQSFLGALPHEHVATWAALALTLLAISSTTAGLLAIIRSAGLALSAVLMVFIGNPFSAVSSAPQLLPDWVNHLGQWLPPGAGANLLRSTAYFGGSGAGGHLTVLLLWTAFGLGAIVAGHRRAAV